MLIIFIIVLLALWYLSRSYEGMTGSTIEGMTDTEAVQNIASIYNKDNMYVTNLKTNTLTLGDKFRMSGVGDVQGNDDWLRLLDKDNKDYYGGMAIGKLYVKDNIQTKSIYTTGNSKGQTHFPFTDGRNYIRGDTTIDGNVELKGNLNIDTITLKDCRWISTQDPGVKDESYPGKRTTCLVNGAQYDQKDPKQWNEIACPAGYIQTGMRNEMIHIKCCKL
jgi:hypothetical protein